MDFVASSVVLLEKGPITQRQFKTLIFNHARKYSKRKAWNIKKIIKKRKNGNIYLSALFEKYCIFLCS